MGFRLFSLSSHLHPKEVVQFELLGFEYSAFDFSQAGIDFTCNELPLSATLPNEDKVFRPDTRPSHFKYIQFGLYILVVTKVGTIGTLGVFLLCHVKHPRS